MDSCIPSAASGRSHSRKRRFRLLKRLAFLSITTSFALPIQQHLVAQQVASEAPLAPESETQATTLPDLPHAVPFLPNDTGDALTIESDTQSRHADIYRLEGAVVITYRNHVVRADRITYDAATSELTLDGHIQLTGGDNDEFLQATRGSYNLNTQTGRFYEVSGSVGLHNAAKRPGYSNTNPFLFSGRMVIKTGPRSYDVYGGSVTSCLLPRPDWQLNSGHFALDATKARAYNSTFRVLNVPILFMPYVTHPITADNRQSGILIPAFNPHSSTKGTIIGEDIYFVLNRSADLTVGMQYFTLRGFSESGTFRYRGIGNDFMTVHVIALQDRGIVINKMLTDQGGQDVTVAFRKKITSKTRIQGDAEYLNSYTYRQAFNESFNQAVSSDITSMLFAVNQQYGFSTAIRADRYQGLKRVPVTTVDPKTLVATTQPGQQVRIFHAPSIDFTAVDHPIGRTPLLWSLTASAAGLKRSQPNFVSSGIIERFDFRPELSLPLSGEGWHTMSSIAVRETIYSRSRLAPYPAALPPIELTDPLARTSLETRIDVRPPAVERDFHAPRLLAHFFGPDIRHTVEPQLVYRNVTGISNFLSVLRFDEIDIASNTNELEYGVTQHLFARRAAPRPLKPCAKAPGATPGDQPAETPEAETTTSGEAPGSIDANGIATPDEPTPPQRTSARRANACPPPETAQQEWLSWRIAQKHFFDPNFGNAIINTRRNVFDTTLNFSGIAFLTEARDISPLISRLRLRTSSHTDIEWDFDLDTGAKKFTSSNIYFDAHEGPIFGAVSYARLNAPGRFYTETIDNNNPNSATLSVSSVSDFSQMRVLLGYGAPTRPGFSAAANAGLDLKLSSLQYGALQTSYNWNCCGVSVEYRKYELGSVRNEGAYKFSITLANIGTAGNLRRTARLF